MDLLSDALDIVRLTGAVVFRVDVNGPWCITFEFADGDAYLVDFEQYH